MKFTVLIPEEIEIPADTVEKIFLSVCEDFLDGKTDGRVHFDDLLHRASSQHGIHVPDGFKYDEDEDNHVTLRQIKAAKKKEGQ